jgi:hypothetical protein
LFTHIKNFLKEGFGHIASTLVIYIN